MAKGRVLEVKVSGSVDDAPARFAWGRRERSSLYEIEAALRRASEDPKIAGVYLELIDARVGWSKAESLHRALVAVRRAGKTTLAYVTGADNATYLLASACETVVVAPSAILSLESLASESLFFKDLLGELGLTPELDAVGEFKSAGEALERRESSEPHRREMHALLADLSARYAGLVAAARGMSTEAVASAIASGPFLPEAGRELGLVDELGHADRCREHFESTLGYAPRYVPHARYVAPPSWIRRVFRWRRPQIAVVHACGVLTSGESRSSTVGARGLGEILTRVRERGRVRAVVLRIESPGGGAVASDLIHRELTLIAREKPVVVSMGDIAASGGYYIAAAAGTVLAESMSLTGSIGVIGGKVVVKGLLDRLGVARELMSVGESAPMFSPLRSFTDAQRAWHRDHLEHFYRERFLPVVAEGRKLTIEKADAAGRGRVWTGRQGREVGLVDALGGLHDAIDVAREQAGLDKARSRTVVYGRRAGLRDLLSRNLVGGTAIGMLAERLNVLEELAREELLLLLPRVFRIR